VVYLHRRISRSRLTTALVSTGAAALVLAAAALPTASAATAASAPVQAGLFGAQDPTYDGVFRQSLALLAYSAAGTTPPPAAVTWLLDQQCADGGFQAFRASTAVACQKSDAVTYSGEDTNSTGIASAALRAIGRTAAADKALSWVLAAQRSDGGFPYFVGGDSDANSTAIVVLGTNTAGRTPASVHKGGVSAAHFLESLQLGCEGAATDDDGGFAFQSYGGPLVDSDAAAVQATLALSGAALPVTSGTVSTDVPRATCPSSASPTLTPAQLGAGHLARLIDTFGAVPQFDFGTGSRVPDSVSTGDTAWAVLSLAAVGVGHAQLDTALAAIGKQPLKAASVRTAGSSTAAAAKATDQPGLLALAALATSAAGGDRSVVTGYVARLGATIRVAPVAASATPSASPSASSSTSPTSDNAAPLAQSGPTPLTPVLGALGGLLLILGLGAVASTRRRGVHA
jgi:hypothetical protein